MLLRSPCDLLQLICHLGDAGLAAGLFLWPAVRCAAEADATDRVFADFDWNAALERNDFRKLPLAGSVGLGALHPFERCPPESPRRVGFAAGKLKIVRRRPIALDKNAQPSGAIDDRNGHPRAAFGKR